MKKILVLSFSLLFTTSLLAGELVVNSNQADPAPRAMVQKLVDLFGQAHPEVDIKVNVYDHEAYKTALRNWLVTSPPDVVFWFAGNRMKQFVDRGLFEDLTPMWEQNGLAAAMPGAAASMSLNNKYWGIPYTYYNWGIYYRTDIFERFGLSEPKTWDELLNVCRTLRSNGIIPVTIGTKYLWTAAGWFDYLNMRVNGYDFHIDLMDGKIPYTDNRVREVFDYWKQLVDANCFIEDHASYSWQEAQPFMYRGEAAMYLIGNFIVGSIPPEVKPNISFFQFPVIKPEHASVLGEDAPTDTLHIPARAKNKEDARKLLLFASRADVQTELNEILVQLPTNKDARPKDDPFLNKALPMLASSQTAQFYDRDTDPDMAKEGMKGFQEFMVNPDRLDGILTQLERTRKRIFE